MKKTLFPALAAALVLAACGTKTTGQAEVAAEAAAQQVVSSDIAYVQVEAVLAQCDLYKNEGVALQEKTEKAQKSWAQREQNLQAEAAQLQQKYEKGLITSRDAQAQQESIQKKVASYQSNAQKEAQTLDEENYVFTNRAQDLLHRAVQEINSGKKYKLILNASALIDADTTLNITPAVLAKVNELYAADKKAEKKEPRPRKTKKPASPHGGSRYFLYLGRRNDTVGKSRRFAESHAVRFCSGPTFSYLCAITET